MKKTLRLFVYVLPLILLGSMVSCENGVEDQDVNGYDVHLDGAYLEDGNNSILVFDGNGTFKCYENDWLYTADIKSYSYGTWRFENSTLILTYTGEYVEGTPNQNFKVSTKVFTITKYVPNTQAFVWITEKGETLTFQKYVRTSVEQYLNSFLVGKWDVGIFGMYDLKSDGTFIKTTDSLKEYGTWSIEGMTLTIITEGYYGTNNSKIPYDTNKLNIYEITAISPSEMLMLLAFVYPNPDASLDQGGGVAATTALWEKISN